MTDTRLRPLVFASVLTLALAVPLAVRASSADTERRTVTVLANWGEGTQEAKAFQNVLDAFEGLTGITTYYQGTTAQREVLAQDQPSALPEVAILPSPGDLREFAAQDRLVALDEKPPDGASLLDSYDEPWISEIDGSHYWVPVKADVKSLIWHRPRSAPGTGGAGDELNGLLSLAADGDNWCLGMGSGATYGWPGTDWVEDLLLQQAGPDVYEAWATGEAGSWTSPQMKSAWRSWGELLSQEGSHRATSSLETTWEQAARELVDDDGAGGGCSLNHMGSVSRGSYQDASVAFRAAAELLPETERRTAAWEVSGDFAAMFRETDEAWELIRFLASAEAQRTWAADAPAGVPPPLSANDAVGTDTYGDDEVSRELSEILWEATEPLCLDASDAMPPAMRDAFRQAVLHFLADPNQPPGHLLQQLEETRSDIMDRNRGGPWLDSVCGAS